MSNLSISFKNFTTIKDINKESIQEFPLTCVSGYWDVSNKHGNNYINEWFSKTLKINCPYVFFTDKANMEIIKKHREGLPTYFVHMTLDEFYTTKYKKLFRTHPIHCPSKELNMIWNEKIFLIEKAFNINPFKSEYFCWVDAGICTYREKYPPTTPFPNLYKLNKLPKDKFIYSGITLYDESRVKKDNYYVYVTGTFMLHKNIIKDYAEIYKSYLEKLIDRNNIWTDQIVNTHIYKDNKHLFYKLGNGWAAIIKLLV